MKRTGVWGGVRLLMVTLTALLWLLAWSQGVAFAEDAGHKVFLWEVESPTTVVYLFGSIHLADAKIYPLDPRIERAFASSDALALEFNPLTIDVPHMRREIQRRGMYSGGASLKDTLSPSTYAALRRYLDENGIAWSQVERMRAGLLTITLSDIAMEKLGFMPRFGIDLHFAVKAEGHKPIVELETLDQQLDVMLDTSSSDALLAQTLAELKLLPQEMQKILHAWSRGDAATLERLLITEPLSAYPKTRPEFDRIFFQRNERMAQKIKGYLASRRRYFVVVGAGHLVGRLGIVERLRRAGYHVRQL